MTDTKRPALNAEQEIAVGLLEEFLKSDDLFFVLEGAAGTGKTFSLQEFIARTKGRLIFTAPTNKATKVLRDMLTCDGYKPECRTVYSLLGLRLEANGEVKGLTVPEDPLDLTLYKAVIVDEGSMINKALMSHITATAENQKVKFIFMGDPAQLPPVKESRSPIWTLGNGAKLEKVMRHDNQILELATRLRKVVDHPAPQIKLDANNADGEGVWRCTPNDFAQRLLDAADQGRFSKANCAKAIAWRNVTVDQLNRRIRGRIFDNPVMPWLVDDRIIVTEPAKGSDDEIFATTDDEGRITHVAEDWHPTYPEFKCWRLSVTTDDNRTIVLRPLQDSFMNAFNQKAERLAQEARSNSRKWRNFWDFKEAFHKVRHGYAITAHRAQGSTYEAVFVDWKDILLNQNRQEAFRCLYVACTRPKKELYLG